MCSEKYYAAIGPCITVKNYEIKQDFIKKFLKKDKKNIFFLRKLRIKIILI